ncbi:4'-phosphopantetheinyl transferase [Aquiflexum balticum DSM 16537]|uniref:4'-phosphopantetheinyl transferase n=1 Tax=Aquiflexum balticum DSM 16537 TaxID=758820 RepID=A0A1W2GZC6_9BACT|nr:4'-phosphopantetheinyl transferase superfamily protein [Aquiflexum balticum]SMD41576.1 4'-phosphopantetheinyl transferase [Aquiflexum balticum DSM 16537]
MTSNFSIEWNELTPTWKNFQVEPFSNEIHVVRINISKNLHQVSNHKNLLTYPEKQKLSRIIRQEDKNIFLCSQVMKRIVCGHYLNFPHDEISFDFTENKKPFISGQPDFHFNISHSGDWMTMIISKYPCGIDVEKIQPDFDFEGVIQLTFHPEEIGYIFQNPDQTKAFFRIWTIKESFLKATGVGLIDNLSDLNMMKNSTPLANLNPWQIQSFIIDGNYWCSICYQAQNPKIKFYDY